ncbi:hypothetical protein A3K64_03715 [Candidatus Micrarchaeota archaeon RBG_16_36_9]|nr:MAG: hypothetical protein A3K64_03715 [Candidatus Micrarchaeota archaeon RBG_16_36_9]
MEMKSIVVVFFAAMIVLTIVGLPSPELPFEITRDLSELVIIFSLIAIVSVILSRNKRYYPY